MATARRVQVEITAQDKTGAAFQAVAGKFGNLQGQIAGLAASFSGVQAAVGAALGGAGLGALVTSVADSLDAINDLSDATGASVANVSRLESAVRRTGGTFNDASELLLTFNKALADAVAGGDKARVFEALGLSVQALSKADPVESLLDTARAFETFENNGERARGEMELLGKRIGTLAPTLKNLAEDGAQFGTVTEEQAAAADAFNKALARVQSSAQDAARTTVAELLPALQATLDALNDTAEGASRFDKAGQLLRLGLEAVVYQAAYLSTVLEKVAISAGGSLDRLRALATLDLQGFSAISDAMRRDREKADQELNAFLNRLESAGVGTKLREAKPKDDGPLKSFTLPAKTGNTAAQQAISEAEKYIQRLNDATLAALDLSQVEQARVDIVSGKLGKLTKAQEAQILSLAEGLDLLKAPDPQLAQFDDIERRRQAIEDEGAAIQQLVSASRGAQFDSLVAQTERIVARFNDGTLSAEDYARAIEVLGLRFAALEPEVQASLQQVSTFAEEASRNIQDALGDTLTSALRGDFDSIGDLWEDLLLRMVAQAASAQLNQYLFGAGVGSGGGVLGPVLGSLFGGFRANGGPVEPGRAYVVGERGPEVIVPSSAGTVVPNGSMGAVSITYGPGAVVVGDIATQSQVRQALAAHAAATEGRLRTTLARNGMPVA